jgi:endonuclease/exonuclease/phosphatase family metal-dependent hydrolase
MTTASRLCAPRLAAFLFVLLALPSAAFAHDPIRVMSFNIRYATESDGEHAWSQRRDLAASVIRFHRPDLVGVQEALLEQLNDLEERLPDYDWVGVGRDDGESGGEFSAILYRPDRVELLESDTFWLSETPETPGSKSWDTAITRVVTWALFRDRADGSRFYHFNTHFDHIGQEARRQSAMLIVARIAERAEQVPAIVTGDFNAEPDSPPYAVMAAALSDARLASETPPHGPEGTFSSFVAHREPMPRIDYVFVTEGIIVERFATLAEHWNGRHASDHLPVMADVALP